MACKFFYTNYWDNYTLTETSEHENFPAEYTQHRDFNKAWRSNYGAGSGWGNFNIVTGVNDKIDFEEVAANELTATLVQNEYTADELCTQIDTQLTAASGGGVVYTVTYSDTTNKFTLASDRGGGKTFKLLWATGTNTATSVGDDIGFDVSADDNDAASHEADDLRIHSEERITIDFGAATNIYAVIIRGHNFSATATVEAIFSADAWTTIAEHPDFTVQDDIMVLEYNTPKNYQYVGIRIKDPENSDLYVKTGRPFFGSHFQPTRSFSEEASHVPLDPSVLLGSENGQLSSIQLDHSFTKTYGFIMESADKANFDTMFASRGTSKDLFITEDTSSYLTTTNYVQFNGWQYRSILHSSPVWRLDLEVEKLR